MGIIYRHCKILLNVVCMYLTIVTAPWMLALLESKFWNIHLKKKKTIVFSHLSLPLLLSWVSEEMEPLVGERKPQQFLSWASLLSGGICHLASRMRLVFPVWLVAVPGAGIPRRCPRFSDVCVSGSFSDILGDTLGTLGCFSLCFGRGRLWGPCHCRILPESLWNLTSFLTFSFAPSL